MFEKYKKHQLLSIKIQRKIKALIYKWVYKLLIKVKQFFILFVPPLNIEKIFRWFSFLKNLYI